MLRSTLAELAQDYDLAHIVARRGAGVFGSEKASDERAVDVKTLHAKIGELTLAKDFLEGLLGKPGLLPSAKR